jgi:hypothetical protein
LDNVHLYVWLGTCDLTDYDGKFVTLAANKDIIDSLINTYQKFIDLLKPYPGQLWVVVCCSDTSVVFFPSCV